LRQVIHFAGVRRFGEAQRQNLEKANERVYGTGKLLHFYDSQPDAKKEEEIAVCK
jgi:hypothetical protein